MNHEIIRNELPSSALEQVGNAEFVIVKHSLWDTPKIADADSDPVALMQRAIEARGIRTADDIPHEWDDIVDMGRRHAITICRIVQAAA